jgi:hypothetical protein
MLLQHASAREICLLRVIMVAFFHRGAERRSCETRLSADENGYELVILHDGRQHVERFSEPVEVVSREHELVSAWHAQGWHDPFPTSPRLSRSQSE